MTVASTIGILLIVLGHSFVSADYAHSNPQWFRTTKDVLYGFHIHLFFFLSGFLLAHTHRNRELQYGRFLKARLLRLMFPYYAYFMVNCIPNVLIPGVTQYPITDLDSFLHLLVHPTQNTIKFHWFLVVVFNLGVTAPVILGALRWRGGSWLLLLAALCLHLWVGITSLITWCLSATVFYLIFFWSGAVVQRHWRLLESNIYRNQPWLIVLLGGIVMAFSIIVEPRELLPRRAVDLCLAFSGILVVMAMSRIYVKHSCRILGVFAGLNLSILLMSWYGHRMADGFLNRMLGLGFSAVMPVSFGLALLIPWAAVRYLSGRHPVLDLLLGQPLPKR